MNENYGKWHMTSTGFPFSLENYYYAQKDACIERGEVFVSGDSGVFGSGDTVIYQLKVNSICLDVMSMVLNTNANALTLALYESPTVTDGVTECSWANLNRRKPQAKDYNMYCDPTGVSGGSLIGIYKDFTDNKSVGRSLFDGQYRMKLNTNTDYTIHLTNDGGGNSNYFLQLNLWQHEPSI